MKIERKEKYILITPDDGKLLTNGDTMSKSVYMPLNGDTSVWSEIDEGSEPSQEEEAQALLRYANEITNNNDSTLGDAIKTLTDGYKE